MTIFLIIIVMYIHPFCSTEMVEHDVPPEDLEPIMEEPHHKPIPESQEQDKQLEPEPESEQTMSAVSGFFSGFASVVSSRNSSCTFCLYMF